MVTGERPFGPGDVIHPACGSMAKSDTQIVKIHE